MAADLVKARLRNRTIVKSELPDFEDSFETKHPKQEKGSFQCKQCELRFRTKGFLARHMQLHSDRVPSCARCGIGETKDPCFKCSRLTENVENFSCRICGKSFNQKINLTYHLRVHTGERPFVCGECKAAFKQKSALDNHVRRHTGELPFPCRECGSRFRQRSHLDNHIRLHNGERPYTCDQCDASFTQKSNLNSHVLKHKAINPRPSEKPKRRSEKTKCCVYEKCKKRFRRQSSLTNHLLVHGGERRLVSVERKADRKFWHKLVIKPVKCEVKFEDLPIPDEPVTRN